jgi:Na+/H+ antiporter NhaD/arsenite permease-like protein
LFFLGILLAVGVLESLHILEGLAILMDHAIGNQSLIVFCIGILSAVVDNVPLVAATMAMYDLTNYPPDSPLWEFIAYCAGTGGSLLIIGSAAGVAVMGIEKIDFIWYFKKISFIALLGYIAGAAVYLFMQ